MINIIGNFLGTSGYDVHTRGLANALAKQTDVRLTSLIPLGAEHLLTDKEVEMVKKKPDKDEINLIITNPTFWRLHTHAKRNWAFLIWEGDRIPKSYLTECLNPEIEYILVASEHTRQAILETYSTINRDNPEWFIKRIKIIPHGVDLDKFYPKPKPDKFTFICNKGWRNLEDRGGIQYAVKAFLEEFTSKDNVCLYLKINPAYGVPDINKMLAELKPDKEDFAQIQIMANNVPYDTLVNLYNLGHVLLAPTRSEAFGIPIIEAMACGLPVICTGYGGQTDFVKDKIDGLYLDYDMTEVKWELAYEGISWATPKINDLRKKMRYCYENQDKVKEMGANALETSKSWTWDSSASKVKKLI